MFYKIWCVFYGTSQFALVPSQVLGLHTWPVVTVLDGTILQRLLDLLLVYPWGASSLSL